MSQEPTSLDDFKNLLRLQEADSAIDVLHYRIAHLPAQAELESVQQRASALRPELTQATARRDEQATLQAALEAEVMTIEQRMASLNARLYGESNVSPKDAQSMSEEIKNLDARRRGLEDSELEIMEKVEPLQAEVERLQAIAQGLANEMQVAQEQLSVTLAEVDEELRLALQEREPLVALVADSLLREYESLRPKLGGIAVAGLVGTTCGGCHLTLSANEVDRFRKSPDAAVLHCEECGRILVR